VALTRIGKGFNAKAQSRRKGRNWDDRTTGQRTTEHGWRMQQVAIFEWTEANEDNEDANDEF